MEKNYYLEPECAKCVLAISEMENIDGLGGRKPTLDVGCDVIGTNAQFVVSGRALGVFTDCGIPAHDVDYWDQLAKNINAAIDKKMLIEYQAEFCKVVNREVAAKNAAIMAADNA